MARDLGHEDAGLASKASLEEITGLASKASLEEITRTPSVDTILETNDKRNLAWTTVWKHSILRSVLHHVKDHMPVEGGSSLDNDRIGHLVEIKSLGALRPSHYYRDFTHLLDSAGKTPGSPKADVTAKQTFSTQRHS